MDAADGIPLKGRLLIFLNLQTLFDPLNNLPLADRLYLDDESTID
jgi:hypothetical protein